MASERRVRARRACSRAVGFSAGASTSASSAGAVTGAVGEADWRGRWRSTRIGHDRCPFHPGRTAAGAAVGRDHSRWMVLPSSPTSFARSFAASPQPAEDAADEDIGPVTLNFSELVAPGDSPLGAYERLSKQGVLRWDEAQHRALKTLNELHAKLVGDMDGRRRGEEKVGGAEEGGELGSPTCSPPGRRTTRADTRPTAASTSSAGPGAVRLSAWTSSTPRCPEPTARRSVASTFTPSCCTRTRRFTSLEKPGTPKIRWLYTRNGWRRRPGSCAWTNFKSRTSRTR